MSRGSLELYLERKKRKFALLFFTLLITTFTAFLAHISLGSVTLDPYSVFIQGLEGSGLGRYRLLRASAALICGFLLAASGLLVQTSTRNPLGDPYLLGISSGSLMAVTLSFLIPLPQLPGLVVRTLVAFLGGLLAFTLTHFIAVKAGYTPTSLVLAGVAVGTSLYSISLFPQYLILRDVHKVIAWSMGSFAYVDTNSVAVMVIALIASVAVMALLARPLNVLNISDEFVRDLGYDPKRLRQLTSVLSALFASVTVAWFGIIGFVGLAAPHFARRVIKSGDLRYVIPLTYLSGGLLLLLADLIAKTAFLPHDMPVNVVVSAVGGPTLAVLIAGMRKRGTEG